MDQESFQRLETVINVASSAGATSADERYLNELRSASNRWSIGLELFMAGGTTVVKFFGLSLVRDYLAGSRDEIPVGNRLQIRQVMLNWLASTCSVEASQSQTQPSAIPVYVQNNIATVLVRSLKLDFPSEWPTAFVDILSLSKMGMLGFAVAVRVLIDLDVEVIVYDERRTSEEVTHNSLIKDTMREQNILKDIVEFLCQSTRQLMQSQNSKDGKLTRRCLHALSTMIGWIDVGLIANKDTLGLLYDCLRVPSLAAAACSCFFELVKKGMDPVSKVMMVCSIELLPRLQQIPIPFSNDDDGSDGDGEDDWECTYAEVLATVIDLLFQEVLSCWYLFEEHVLRIVPPPPAKIGSPSSSRLPSGFSIGGSGSSSSSASNSAVDANALTSVGPIAGSMLHQCVPLLLTLLAHPDDSVYSAVIPSLSKLMALYKQQSAYERSLKDYATSVPSCFMASAYVISKPDLLMGIFKAMQHDSDFRFDLNDEDDCEVIETKKQVRKLFVNYCRVAPDMCLQLITTVLLQQPQPLSKAPFPALEATCKLVHAFGEGIVPQQQKQYVCEGTFPQLLQALHDTDISSHPHPQVILTYFELCARYVKQSTEASLCRVVTNVLSRGLRHPTDAQVRSRSAYLFLKMVEGLETKAATLVPVVGSLGDLILSDGLGDKQMTVLTDSAELHLLEAIALITSSSQMMLPNTFAYLPHSAVAVDANTLGLQQQLLSDMVNLLVKQIQSILVHPEVGRYEAEFSAVITHKISSVASLSKGYSFKNHTHAISLFLHACEHGVIPCIEVFGKFSNVRGRLVVFIHRMVQCIGKNVLLVLVVHSVKCIFSYAESIREVEMAVQMLNQLMIEFTADAVPLMEQMLPVVMIKFGTLFDENNSAVATCLTVNASVGGDPKIAIPAHLESERTTLVKLYLMFLQHLCMFDCSVAFYSGANIQYLDSVFGVMLQVLQNDGRVQIQSIGGNETVSVSAAAACKPMSPVVMLGLRKNVVNMLTGLSKTWLGDNAAVSPPENVINVFKSMLFNQFLPMLLSACFRRNPTLVCAGGALIPTADAQGLSLVAEIGGLLWTVVTLTGASATTQAMEFISYLQTSLLPGLGWTVYPSVCAELIDQLSNCIPALPTGPGDVAAVPCTVGVYKENFKKSIKALVAAAKS